HPVAQFSLGGLYATGAGVDKDETEADKWFAKAAKQGYADAQFMLGSRYEQGLGVKQSDAQAYVWISLAAAAGTPNSKGYAEARDQTAKKLSAEELAAAQKRVSEWKPAPAHPG